MADSRWSSARRARRQLGPILADAVDQLKANWRSHALTLMGIVWGATAVILLLALGAGFDDFLDVGLQRTGDRWIQVAPGFATAGPGGRRIGRALRFGDEDLEQLRAGVPSASEVSGETQLWLPVETPKRLRATWVSASSPNLQQIQQHAIARGRYLSDDDESQGRRVAVLGAEMARVFFETEDPIGKVLQIERVPFEVIGVLKRKGLQLVTHRDAHDRMIFVPLSSGRVVVSRDEIGHIYLNPWSIADEPAVRAEARETIRRLHHLLPGDVEALVPPEDDGAIRIFSVPEATEGIRNILAALHVALGLIGTVMLAMAGVGVANLMTAVTHERAREFAMRRACGARRSDLVLQLLGESFVVVLAGGVIGVALSLLAVAVLQVLPLPPDLPRPRVSLSVVLTTFSILVATGIAAGVLPARLASRVDPSVALRVT